MAFYRSGRKPVSEGICGRAWTRFTSVVSPARAVGSVTRDDIAAVVAAMLRELNGNTTRRLVVVLRSFFKWCQEDRLIEANPVQWGRLPRIPEPKPERVPFTQEQFERVTQVAGRPEFHSYWPSACVIGFHTGMRLSDVAGLRWQADSEGRGSFVSFADQLIVARPIKLDAMRQRLEIPMEPDLHQYLMRLWNERGEGTGSPYVMPLAHGGYIARTLSPEFRRICDLANLPDHSFHSFRHGFVTRLLNAGVDAITIGAMTGQTISQVEQYAHVSMEGKREALARARKNPIGIRLDSDRSISL